MEPSHNIAGPSTAQSRSRWQWIWIAGIWFGVALFDATQTVFVMRSEGMQHAWGRLFFVLTVSWIPWAAATPLVLRLAHRYPAASWRNVSIWAVHVGALLVIGVSFAAWTSALEKLFNPYAVVPGPAPFMRLLASRFYSGLLAYVVLYAFILVINYVLDSRARLVRQQAETAQLNEQLTLARLDALRRQIEPHFLFNTLNAVAGLVRENRNDDAVSMIAGLSDCLRYTMANSSRQQVPLREEMEFLQRYLDIQKARLADRLQLTVEIPSELLPAQVPSLILQPMVENAIKHGIAKRTQGGALRISGFRSNGSMTLSVSNDGPSLPERWEETQSGIGVANVRTRLRGLYGDAFDFSMKNQVPDGVEVSFSIPFVPLPVTAANVAVISDQDGKTDRA